MGVRRVGTTEKAGKARPERRRAIRSAGIVGGIVAILLVAGACAPPPDTPPGAGACLKTFFGDAAAPIYVRWNGAYGATANFARFTDATCTVPSGSYQATFQGPDVPVPSGLAGWWEAPDYTVGYAAAFEHSAAASNLCKDLLSAPAFGWSVEHVATQVNVPNSVPTDLWACIGYTATGTIPAAPAP